jgi:hypothetical protein
MIKQEAPWPAELEDLINGFKYKPGWTFKLIADLDRGQGSEGTTLDIVSRTYNSYHPNAGEAYYVHHYVIVPPAAFNRRSWRYWLLQRLIEIETHEACEFFQDGDERPFAPNHGPGNDPYMIVTLGTEEEAKTSFRGDLNP